MEIESTVYDLALETFNAAEFPFSFLATFAKKVLPLNNFAQAMATPLM